MEFSHPHKEGREKEKKAGRKRRVGGGKKDEKEEESKESRWIRGREEFDWIGSKVLLN